MARSVEEWIGRNDDQKVPPRVRMRVFDREGGICYLTGRKIDPIRDEWDVEHKVALILGGEHRESNLFPALREPHRRKTAVEMKVKSKIAKVRKKHLGITKPKSSLSHPRFKRCMDGTVVDRRTGEVVSR
ncbi:HNH endonuclease [Sinorhizobium americanum]|uniref:Restriction endonuclease n=1 Tax=Sinorhizobium americanum TaxID=194963 RepID=A0A1L3LM08_9HYPH|nr:HNH endonuclease [Sinorhizobium americanum]APG91104.1 restriction endonuclease [Sinorhizobium americanum]OAP43688.1 HNH endonuclease [Sinorhizobium americanum]